jgi:hypothetical protein
MSLHHFQRLLRYERHDLNTVAYEESRKLPPVTSSAKGTSLVQTAMKGRETWLLTQGKDVEERPLKISLRSRNQRRWHGLGMQNA